VGISLFKMPTFSGAKFALGIVTSKQTNKNMRAKIALGIVTSKHTNKKYES
jgi:hypothetical protein